MSSTRGREKAEGISGVWGRWEPADSRVQRTTRPRSGRRHREPRFAENSHASPSRRGLHCGGRL